MIRLDSSTPGQGPAEGRNKLIVIGINPAIAKYLPSSLREIGIEPAFILSRDRIYEGEAREALGSCENLQATIEDLSIVSNALQEKSGLVQQAFAITTLYDDVFPIVENLANRFRLASPSAPIPRLSEKAQVCRIIPEFCPESHLIKADGLERQDLPSLSESKRWIIKPSRSCGAVGIVGLKSASNLAGELERAIQDAEQRGLHDGTHQEWIVQERINGLLISLEGFVHAGSIQFLGFSRRARIGLTEVGNEFPVDDELPALQKALCRQAVEALVARSHFQNGYFHCEFLWDAQSVFLIDANMGRLAGGPALEQIALSFGLRAEDVIRHVLLLPIVPDGVRSPFPTLPVDRLKTLGIIYGLDRSAVLEAIRLPPNMHCRHTQLASTGHPIVPVGVSDLAWVGQLTGQKHQVLDEINGITIHTSDGPLKPTYLVHEEDWDL